MGKELLGLRLGGERGLGEFQFAGGGAGVSGKDDVAGGVADSDAEREPDAECNADSIAHSHALGHANGDAECDADVFGYTHTECDAHAECHPQRNAYPESLSNAGVPGVIIGRL